MATDSNTTRKVFSFARPPANPLFPVAPAVATAPLLPVSNDVLEHLGSIFTREDAQKTRLEGPRPQAPGSHRPSLSQSPAETEATTDRNQDISDFGGFTRSHEPVSLLQPLQPSPLFSLLTTKPKNTSLNTLKAPNTLLPTQPDAMTAGPPNLTIHPKSKRRSSPPANFPANGTEKSQNLQYQRTPLRPQSKTAFTRSSTPAQDTPEVDAAPVDYGVFHSLMVSQAKKDKLIREKGELLNEARQEVGTLQKQNTELAAELDRIKEKTRNYIQQCDKLVRSAQNEARAYHKSLREAYTRCIEEVQTLIPNIQGLKSELTERVQRIEIQLDEEHQHRAKLGPEILHELETLKHKADYLRDQLLTRTEDLAEAKFRVQELEAASLKENVTLTNTIKLLEDTRKDLAAARRSAIQDIRIHSAELEGMLEENARVAASQISDLQQANQALVEAVQLQKEELARLKADLAASTLEADTLKALPDELSKAKDALTEKDHHIAIIRTQQQAYKTQIEGLSEQVKNNEDMKARLEEALRCSAILEAQHTEHLANYGKAKARIERLERELVMAQNQCSEAQVEYAFLFLLLEGGFENLRATSRVTKQDLIDVQDKLDRAQEYAKKQQNIAKEQLEKAAEERKKLEGLLEQNIHALKKAQEDLTEARSETKRVQSANEAETLDLRTQLAEYQKHTSTEKCQLQASVIALEKELEGSASATKELRNSLVTQRSALDETVQAMNQLSAEKGKIAQELEASLTNCREISDALVKTRTAGEAEIKARSLEKAQLESRAQELDRALALSREELGKAQLQVRFLTGQVAEVTRALEEKTAEGSLANERLLRMENKMDSITVDLSDAKASIQIALGTVAAPQDATPATFSIELLNTQIAELQEQLKAAQDRNAALGLASQTLLDRHQRQELTEQESALVKLVATSTMQVNEKERIQSANDLRRVSAERRKKYAHSDSQQRDITIQALQKRIKELEKQLASRIERKSPTGQLMTMTDVLHSSPLSIIEDGEVILQQRVLAAATTPAKQTAPNFLSSVDQSSTAKAILHHPVAPAHTVTFAKLNQASSEDAEGDDAIWQFSDQKMNDILGMQDHLAPVRAMKRGRGEDGPAPVGPGGGKHVATRTTRRRRLSNGGISVGADGVTGRGHAHDFRRVGGMVDEGKSVTGTAEGGSTSSVAKYKMAQRGKVRR